MPCQFQTQQLSSHQRQEHETAQEHRKPTTATSHPRQEVTRHILQDTTTQNNKVRGFPKSALRRMQMHNHSSAQIETLKQKNMWWDEPPICETKTSQFTNHADTNNFHTTSRRQHGD